MNKKIEISGNIQATRDVILGDQHVRADLDRVETLLAQILEFLRQPETRIQVAEDRRAQQKSIFLFPSDQEPIEVTREFLSSLGQLQKDASPQRKEEIYLTRFSLDHLYARWERTYLPLAGMLHLDPGLRLTDATDQGISTAGTKLEDLRQAIREYSKTRLVILGEPGAGKTTTLERLALDLARGRLHNPFAGKIPIRIDLFKFTDQRNPSEFLATEWQFTGLATSYGEALAQGQVCFLLDGLNQMPVEDRTRRIEKWAHWANSHADLPQGNWAIFTCRQADYTSSLRLPEVHVQTLDADRMRRYFDLRFGPEQAARHWGDFERKLRSVNQQFERLARNPFMLSLLADNVAEGHGLNDNRARLMDRLAQRLLNHELIEGRQPENLTADPLGTLNAAMQLLSRVAFHMQTKGEGTGLGYEEARQMDWLATNGPPLSVSDVVDLSLDAHLLEETVLTNRQGVSEKGISFYHHLLQEYFAARHVLDQFRTGKSLRKFARVPWRWWMFISKRLSHGEAMPPPPVTAWEETLIMAAALAGKDAPKFLAALERENLPLAGRALAEGGAERPELAPLAKDFRQKLLARQRTPHAHLRARVGAGLALGEVGHPNLLPQPFEFEGRTVMAILPAMETIPAGAFLLGSAPDDKQADDDEKTPHRRQTLEEFKMGRYPMTNAEYRYFIEAGGYREDRWWSEGGRVWKKGGPDAHAGAMEDWLNNRKYFQTQDLDAFGRRFSWVPQTMRYWKRMTGLSEDEATEQAQKQFERPFDRPGFWDDPDRSHPARPVVGVNWYEAEAYCAWLSAITGKSFALPDEWAWEKAARGTDGQVYPWGDRFESHRCNSIESHIFTTSPVGLYPNGLSPYGLFDMSGNCWEWTNSWYQAYPGSDSQSGDFGEKYRVVRGGAFSNYRLVVRCAYRYRNSPGYFFGTIGFRVAVTLKSFE